MRRYYTFWHYQTNTFFFIWYFFHLLYDKLCSQFRWWFECNSIIWVRFVSGMSPYTEYIIYFFNIETVIMNEKLYLFLSILSNLLVFHTIFLNASSNECFIQFLLSTMEACYHLVDHVLTKVDVIVIQN